MQERTGMEYGEVKIAERLEAAAALLERALNRMEERETALSGEVERISATVDAAATRREAELCEKLAAAERELTELKAAAAQSPLNPLRRTVPAVTTEMLAKQGIGDGSVDVRKLDAALAGLSLEQRIAVKSRLIKAGTGE
jgi:F0F1-type ATP synthase membrane subunit b/b'